MPTNKQIAIAFFTMLGMGVFMIAWVWRAKGNVAFVVGIIGALLVITALNWLANMLDERFKARQLAKKLEGEARFINKEIKVVEAPAPTPNPALKKKLRWFFIGTMVIGFGASWIGLQLNWSMSFVAITLPLGLWGTMMWASLHEKPNPEKPTYDFVEYWEANPDFRRNNALFGAVMILVVLTGTTLTPPPPHAAPMIIGTFSIMLVVLLAHMFYLQFALQKAVESWSISEKRLEQIVDVSTVVLLMVGYTTTRLLMPNLVEELDFSLLFAGMGLVLGYFVHDYLKNRFTEFFDEEERKWSILVKTYLGCLILTLCSAAILNHQTAANKTQTRVYKVTRTSSNYKKSRYLWLEIAGTSKRFEPKPIEWEKLQPGDSARVLVGTGVLGFDYILKFEPK